MQTPDVVIRCEKFTVHFPQATAPVFAALDLTVPRGVIFGIFGDTGCGKTTLAQCLSGFVPASYMRGDCWLHFAQQPPVAVHAADETTWRGLRGRHVVYVPQDPYKTLNPYETVEKQLARVLQLYARRQTPGELLEEVGLGGKIAAAFPHALSAGQKQRIMVAHALCIAPPLVILDEPTASVDAEGRQVLQQAFRRLAQRGSTVVVISHEIEEYDPLIDKYNRFYFSPPADIGPGGQQKKAAPQESDKPLFEIVHVGKRYPHAASPVLRDASLQLGIGEWLYLQGRNGCGKTTLLQILLALVAPDSGQFRWQGEEVPWTQVAGHSRYIHAVFQDTFHSLDPSWQIQQTLAEVIDCAPADYKSELAAQAQALWQHFALPDALRTLFPHQLSYGQQKRVCLLRTLLKYRVEHRRHPGACHLLLLDEVFAGIHWELREIILRLLAASREERVAILWIAHGHNELKGMCDRICRLEDGVISVQEKTTTG